MSDEREQVPNSELELRGSVTEIEVKKDVAQLIIITIGIIICLTLALSAMLFSFVIFTSTTDTSFLDGWGSLAQTVIAAFAGIVGTLLGYIFGRNQ